MSGIIRVVKDTRYSVIANAPLSDASLSWEARGVLGYLLTKPDNWTVKTSALVAAGPGGRERMLRILQELEAAGYLTRTQTRDEHGRMGDVETVLRETPAEPESAQPESEKPTAVSIYNQELKQLPKGDSKESRHADAWQPFKEAFRATFALGPSTGTWKLAAKAIEVLCANGVTAPDAVATWEAFVFAAKADKSWRFVRAHSSWEALGKWIADGGQASRRDDWRDFA